MRNRLGAFKVWVHCLFYCHQQAVRNFGRSTVHFCWDCDYGNNEDTRIIKKIWAGGFDKVDPNDKEK